MCEWKYCVQLVTERRKNRREGRECSREESLTGKAVNKQTDWAHYEREMEKTQWKDLEKLWAGRAGRDRKASRVGEERQSRHGEAENRHTE